MPKSILVVAAHADDEALGCAGTIARHVSEGDSVSCLLMTDGVGARGEDRVPEIQRRKIAMEKASLTMGISNIRALDFPDNQMDSIPLLQVVQEIEKAISEHRPHVIYTHFRNDLNVDHRVTFQATLTACRPQVGHPVKEILSFEVPSSTEWAADHLGPGFVPKVFVDISNFISIKMAALNDYSEEMRKSPHPRSIQSIKALATLRGSSIGAEYAEAFEVVRMIR